MGVFDVVILAVWVVFWIGWMAAAAGSEAGRTTSRPAIGIRVGLILIVFLLIRIKAVRGHGTFTRDPWLQAIGCALFLLGLMLAVWARVHLGRNWGMPMSEKVEPELVTNGPYRTIRHPIYSGFILAMLGTAIAVSIYWLVVALVLGGYFVYSAVVEERNMSRLFPNTYPEYKRSTKMLIPLIL
jgi:protein-S-isoprenylcysteine O-methyltransferase Ste14